MLSLLKATFDKWNKDHAPRLGAALAYYMVFSLGPLLLILIALVGLAWGQAAAENQLVETLQSTVGPQGAQFIQAAIAGASRPREGLLASAIGLVTLLLGAIGVFVQLQEALNEIWGVTPRPHLGWQALVRNRLLSFGMVLVIGLLLLVSLVVQVGIEAAFRYLGSSLPFSSTLVQGVDFFASLAVITLLFALIFKYLPDAEIAWKDVWIGALLTALLFLIGRFALGLYLASSAVGSAYGAAGSLVVVLTWIYYSAQILFFGAEFTQVYATRYGHGIVPSPNAQRITELVRG